MPPPVAQQIITSMKIIMGEDGTNDGKLDFYGNIKLYQYSNITYPFLLFLFQVLDACDGWPGTRDTLENVYVKWDASFMAMKIHQ